MKELVKGASTEFAVCVGPGGDGPAAGGKYHETRVRTGLAGFKTFETAIPDHFPGADRIHVELQVLPEYRAGDRAGEDVARDFLDKAKRGTAHGGFGIEEISTRGDLALFEDRKVTAQFVVLRLPLKGVGATCLRFECRPSDDPASAIVAIVSVNHPTLSAAAKACKFTSIVDTPLSLIMLKKGDNGNARFLVLRQVKLPKIGCLPVSFLKNKVRTKSQRTTSQIHAELAAA